MDEFITVGSSQVQGTNNAETLTGSAGADTINGLAGADLIDAGAGNDSVVAGLGDDTVNGGAGKDTILGGAGDDVIDGGEGDDLLRGQVGNDTIFGGEGNDNISGGTENDLIEGGAGNDKLYGDQHDDTLVGGAGADRLDGGADNDLLIGGEGADYLKGGTGNDVFLFDIVKDNPTGAALNAKELDTIADFTSGEDKLNIQVDGKTIAPTEANFKAMDASIYKGAAPMLTALAAMPVDGTQFVYLYNLAGGGTSGYLVVLEGSATGTVVKYAVQLLGATDDKDLTLADFVQPAPVVVDPDDAKYNFITGTDAASEEIYGTPEADYIDAKNGFNYVEAKAGDDVVIGGKNIDVIYGDDGDDVLDVGTNEDKTQNDLAFGGAGNDKLKGHSIAELLGGSGDDTLSGSEGSEFITLSGNGGSDTYLVAGNEKSLLISDQDTDDYEVKDGRSTLPVDTLEFGAAVDAKDLEFNFMLPVIDSSGQMPSFMDLLITSKTDSDFQITVKGQFDRYIEVEPPVRDDFGYGDGYGYGYDGEGEFPVFPGNGDLEDPIIVDGEGEFPGFPGGDIKPPVKEVGQPNVVEKDVSTIEKFKFADGVTLTADEIFAMVNKQPTDFADIFIGTGEGEFVNGLAGDDLIYGNAGDDILIGDDGSSVDDGGNDTLYGGSGDDFLDGGLGRANFLFGGSGNDSLISSGAADILDGGAGDDFIELLTNNSQTGSTSVLDFRIASGGAGNDTFALRADYFKVNGDKGNDNFEIEAGNGAINDASGSDKYKIFSIKGGDLAEVTITDSEGLFDEIVFDRYTIHNPFDPALSVPVLIRAEDVKFEQNQDDLSITLNTQFGNTQSYKVINFFNSSDTIENFHFTNVGYSFSADSVREAIINNDGVLEVPLD